MLESRFAFKQKQKQKHFDTTNFTYHITVSFLLVIINININFNLLKSKKYFCQSQLNTSFYFCPLYNELLWWHVCLWPELPHTRTLSVPLHEDKWQTSMVLLLHTSHFLQLFCLGGPSQSHILVVKRTWIKQDKKS